jgi:hypothetical protein
MQCSSDRAAAPDGSALLTLGASSIPMGPEGTRRIVWMINEMIKQVRQLGSRLVLSGTHAVPSR